MCSSLFPSSTDSQFSLTHCFRCGLLALQDWWIGGSYRNCKLALTMTTALLQQRLASKGIDSVSVDPGAVYSGGQAGGR